MFLTRRAALTAAVVATVGLMLPSTTLPVSFSDSRVANVAPAPSASVRLPVLFDVIDRAMCSAGRTSHEIIAYSARKTAPLNFYGRVSLQCGNANFGYEHIKLRHAKDWQAKLTRYGGRGTWDDFMSFSTAQALAHPSAVVSVGGGKYCYTTPIQLYQGGKLVNTFYPKVIVSTTSRRLITSYPTSKGC